MPRHTTLSAMVALALAGLAAPASAQFTGSLVQGPSSSQSPYVQGIAGYNIFSILTTGDSVGGYRMVGVPDGLGAYDNGNGTFTVLMNHEITNGITRAHGGVGAFVSEFVIDKATLSVQSGGDLIQRVYGWDTATQTTGSLLTTGLSFARFCSADLAPTSAFSYGDLGTTMRLFLNGEENGNGRALATVATGADKGSAYVLGKFNLATDGTGNTASMPSWENLLANPYSQLKTVVIGNSDGGNGFAGNALSVYVGTKTNAGSAIDRAGLTNGVTKFVTVAGNPVEITDSTNRTTGIASGTRFSLTTNASTAFSRPEDGAWDTRAGKQNVYYFVTTDRLDTTELAGGTQKGATRLWRMTFDDIANPDAGGKIDLLVDGSTAVGGNKPNMWDNISVNKDGTITLLEDTGGADHNGKNWEYNLNDGSLKIVTRSDPARFGDVVGGVFVGPAARTTPTPGGYHTFDEESSGVIDVTDIFDPTGATGKKYQLFDLQDHASAASLIAAGLVSPGANATELQEGGQLLLMTSALAPVPEPGGLALAMAGLGAFGIAARRRRR